VCERVCACESNCVCVCRAAVGDTGVWTPVLPLFCEVTHPLLKSRRPEGGCQTAAGTLQNRRLCLLLFTPLKVIHFLCNKSKNTEVCKEFLHLFQTKLNSTRWPSSNPAFFLHCFPAQANCDKEIHRHSCFFFFFLKL